MANYSNAYFAFANLKGNLAQKGMTPLTLWLSGKVSGTHPTDDVVDQLVAEANRPEFRDDLFFGGQLQYDEIGKDDVLSSLRFLFPSDSKPESKSGRVVYDVKQKYPTVMSTSEIAANFEDTLNWTVTNPLKFNGDECINSLTNFNAQRPAGFQWANANVYFPNELK